MDLAGKVIGCAIEVHKQLGPGLLESAYQTCLLYELRQKNIQAHSEIMCSIDYKGLHLDAGYRIDLLVEHQLIVELKAVDKLNDVHVAQIITYMKLAKVNVGLLINFNEVRLVKGLRRIVI